jgi:hypothetical protein
MKVNPLILLLGIPVIIVLGGTAIGPVVNLSLIAIEVLIFTRPNQTPVTQV